MDAELAQVQAPTALPVRRGAGEATGDRGEVVVSVLLPVRNGGPFLGPALDSVLAQAGVAFEIICIDDRSDDETWPLLQDYAARHPHLTALRATGHGIADALNQALALARGRYVARMDADDICLPGRLAIQAAHLDARPAVGVLGTQAGVIDALGLACGRMRVPVGADRVAAALETSSPLIHPSIMARREALTGVGGYRSLFGSAEDYDLWLRLAPFVQIDNLPQTLLLYRRHREQDTMSQPFRQARHAALAMVAARLRRERSADPIAHMQRMADWRAAYAAVDPGAVDEVRQLTASCLADNGGTLRPRGATYLRLACNSVGAGGRAAIRRRLALACVRHGLQMMRRRRLGEAVQMLSADFLRWPRETLRAYVWHASILWRATPNRRGTAEPCAYQPGDSARPAAHNVRTRQ